VAKPVTEDAKGTRGVAEGASDLLRGSAFDKASAERFILALFGMGWFEEEAVGLC
jgi:hypothetical protein